MKSMFILGASTLLAALALAQPQYSVTDLGTLGGPGTNSNPLGINAFGWTAARLPLVWRRPHVRPRHAGWTEMHHL
jgi:hypothetical protein